MQVTIIQQMLSIGGGVDKAFAPETVDLGSLPGRDKLVLTPFLLDVQHLKFYFEFSASDIHSYYVVNFIGK